MPSLQPGNHSSFGLPGRAYKLSLRRVRLDRLDASLGVSSHSGCYKSVLTANLTSQSQRLWLVGPAIDIGFLGIYLQWFVEARRLHVISGSWFGSLMPFSLHAPRHIGMEEVGWWGDPRRWDYRHASMRRQAWRRLGGGETRVRGLYSRSRFFFL